MSYRVELPVFCGPLDLLLHLVKQQEVDVHEVQISTILDRYLEHMAVLESLDLHDLGEFLVMASTLMEIKSREMLPSEEVEIEAELDPRDDLIRRLLDYKRYRDLSRRLDRLSRIRSRMLEARVAVPAEIADSAESDEPLLDLGDVEIWTLTAAFARLLDETGQHQKSLNIGIERRNVRHYTERVLELVQNRSEVEFEELFDRSEGRYGLIGVFVAILEMMKQGVLRAYQGPGRNRIVVAYRGRAGLTADELLSGGTRLDADERDAVAFADTDSRDPTAQGG